MTTHTKVFAPVEKRNFHSVNSSVHANSLSGFTLIETLVAIFILTLGIMGPLTAVTASTNIAKAAQDKITATFLAEEGMEYIVARELDNQKNNHTYLTGLTPCTSGKTCAVDASDQTATPVQCFGTCPPLYFSETGVYNQQSAGVPTKFTRSITITAFPANSSYPTARVVSTVSWAGAMGTQSVSLQRMVLSWW